MSKRKVFAAINHFRWVRHGVTRRIWVTFAHYGKIKAGKIVDLGEFPRARVELQSGHRFWIELSEIEWLAGSDDEAGPAVIAAAALA